MSSPLHARTDAGEAELVARLRARDEAAFAELIREHGPRMLAAVRRLLRNEEDAQDALQEAFLQAFRALGGFQAEARLSTWLHRIAINAALMRLRSKSRRREGELDALLPEFNDAGQFAHDSRPRAWAEPSDAEAERADTRELVRRAIDELPETYRTALLLRDIEALETAEVARHLGISSNAVKIRVHRARQALRHLLDRHMGKVGP